MPTIVKTNISKAYWFSNEESVETCFRPAIVKSMHTSDNTPEEISWFDKLFEGGIFIPKKPSGNDKRALTILITGPPGSGKSTLAMELCYRLTRTGQLNGERINALYLTSESDEQWLIQKSEII
jgi:predicted ATP-dependent serine protease